MINVDPKGKWHLSSFVNKWKVTFKKCIMNRNILTLEIVAILTQINI